MDAAELARGAVVLTTHERSGYFTSVLGDDIDLRFGPLRSGSFYNLLHNIVVAGGRLVIVDEAFFIDVDDMALGFEQFFSCERDPKRLKFVVVCTRRSKGDLLLAFLVMYCGIYNIVYGKNGVDVSIELDRLMRRENTRADVIDLAQDLGWQCAKQYGALRFYEEDEDVGDELDRRSGEQLEPITLDQMIELDDLHVLSVHIELSTQDDADPA